MEGVPEFSRTMGTFSLTDPCPESTRFPEDNGEPEDTMASLPKVGIVHVVALEKAYWVGAAKELTDAGYLSEEMITVGPKGAQRIIRPLPTPDELDMEVRSHYATNCGVWLNAVHDELLHMLEDIVLLDKYKHTSEVLAHALETFDFSIPAPYNNLAVAVNPKFLKATLCHRQDKKYPSDEDRATEVTGILMECAAAVTENFSGHDAATLADNLLELSKSVADERFPA